MPIVGRLSKLIGSIYIPRAGTPEQREEVLKTIEERLEIIENNSDYNPLLIFAEGGTTNGSALMKFKKGAFNRKYGVTKPCILRYQEDHSVVSAYDIIELVPLAVFHLSWGCLKVNVIDLPEFRPNDYFYQHH
jgi:lysophosphatidylcholine acyltransferase/lyso-PAF acetyltransferase